MIHIYYGNGKGKTILAVGSAVRGAGAGINVLFVQFLKSNKSSERKILEAIPNITVTACSESYKFVCNMSESEKELAKAQAHKQFTAASSFVGNNHMIILDEIFSAVDVGFIPKDALIEFLKRCPKTTELILTGHFVSTEFLNLADYVSEIKKIRHPYDNGTPARKGIEF